MRFLFTPYILPLALSTIITVGLSIHLWLRRTVIGVLPFVVLLLAVSEWTASYCLELLGADLPTKQFWAQIEYFGIVTLPLAWLYFSLEFSGRQRKRTIQPWLQGLLLIVPVFILIMVWTPSLKYLIWIEQLLVVNGPYLTLETTYGAGFWFFVVYTYVIFLFGSYLLLRTVLFSQTSQSRNQISAILLAVLAPWVGNILYLFHWSPFAGVDLSPFGFSLSCLALTWGIFNQKLMDLLPIANATIVEHLHTAAITLDEDGRVINLNPAAVALFKTQIDARVEVPFRRFSEAWPELADAIPNDYSKTFVGVIQRLLDSSQCWYDLRISALSDRKGNQIGRLILLTDVTNETKQQFQLQDAEARYRTLVEQLPAITYIDSLDNKTPVTYLSPQVKEILGYSPDELKASLAHWYEIIHPDDRQRFIETELIHRQTFIDLSIEYRLIARDGRVVWVQDQGVIVYDEEGRPVFSQGVLIDISSRKEAEERLHQSEDRYRDLVENSHDLVCTHDLDGYLLSVNQFVISSLGRRIDQLVGKNLSELLSPGSHVEVDNYLKNIRESGAARGMLKVRDRLGEVRIWEYDNNLRTDGVENPIVRGIARDVTEEYKAKKELQHHLLEMTILHAISQASVEAGSEDTLIQEATRIIGESIYPDNFGILLLDQDRGVLCFHPSYRGVDFDLKNLCIPLGKGVVGIVAATSLPRCISDVTSVPEYIISGPGMHSELCVPLKVFDRLIGVINAESTQLDAFRPEDERLLVTFANQLGLAIERLRSQVIERQQAQLLARSNALIGALSSVATKMEATHDPDGLLGVLGDELIPLGFHCLVALAEPDSQGLRFRYTSLPDKATRLFERLGGNRMDQICFTPDEMALPGRCIKEIQQMTLKDGTTILTRVLPGFTHEIVERILKKIDLLDGSLVIHLPLQMDDKFIGVLWLMGIDLENSDLPTMGLFARQTASALENARLFEETQRLAITDSLTGLNTRRNFFTLAKTEFDRSLRFERSLIAIMIDVDHFKQVNDKFGHAVGDEALRTIAQQLKANLRSIDIIGRYGGEEFVILLPDTSLSDALQLAERLRSCIVEEVIEFGGIILKISISIGVAALSSSTANLKILVDQADNALLRAKHAGRNQVVV